MSVRTDMYIERRQNETREDAARRTAIDALYTARDAGRDMHAAGCFAADAVLAVIVLDAGTNGRVAIP